MANQMQMIGATDSVGQMPGNSALSLSKPKDSVEYTCPMHPQIRQAGPGKCPICGMTLEPVTATAN